MKNIPIEFTALKWDIIPELEYPGESGASWWRTMEWPGLRIRMVRYSAGYKADHWCTKGHIVHCLKGAFIHELRSGARMKMEEGMSYIVSDEASEHRSHSEKGAVLFIIDGEFLIRHRS